MSKEPVNKKTKHFQTKLNLSTKNATSISTTLSEPGSSTQPAEEPQSSSSVPAETTTGVSNEPSQAGSDCVEDCSRDMETGKAAQLIIDKKETARSFGQRERYFNADWYKNRAWLVLCKTTK